jgi:PAS domain S-box-containing protein
MSWRRLFGRSHEPGSGGEASAARYRAAFEQSFELLALLDRDGRVTEVNATLLSFFGLTAPEVMGRRLDELDLWGGGGQAARLGAAAARALRGDFVRDEVPATDAGGNARRLDVSMKPLRRPGGAVVSVMVEARDVTERRNEQAMLAQARTQQAIGQLTSGIAHDFNNLLTVIAGNLEMLSGDVAEGSAEQQRAERALEAVFRGKDTITKLLALARKQELRREAFDAEALLVDVKALLDDTLGERYAVVVDAQPGSWLCHSDRAQLEAAVINLAVNARDAMPDGGAVVLHLENVSVAGGSARARRLELAPGDYVAISVADHGSGIAPDALERVIEPFYTTKPQGLGSGLGLSTSHGFAAQSGGALHIDSEIGVGTRVTIYLPRATDDMLGPAGAAPEAA